MIDPLKPELGKYCSSPPPLRELAKNAQQRKTPAPAAAQALAAASPRAAPQETAAAKEAAPQQGGLDPSVAAAGAASGEGEDLQFVRRRGFTVGPEGAPRPPPQPQPQAPPGAAGAGGSSGETHWGQLSGVIKADQITIKVMPGFNQLSPLTDG